MDEEEWRPVVGYEGLYSVSNLGRVRSEDHISASGSRRRGRILKQWADSRGYKSCRLYKSGIGALRFSHRLVCEAFHGPQPEDKSFVLHWDDNKGNNRADNLRWGTNRENQRDSVRNGTNHESNKTHCPHGHEYTDGNVYIEGNRKRKCRSCVLRRARERYWVNKGGENIR